MNTSKILSIVIIGAVLVGGWWFLKSSSPAITPMKSPSPSASVSVSPIEAKTPITAPAITIISPKANELVDSPVTITGRARVFENQFTVQLKDSTDKVIYQQNAVMTDAKDAGLFGNYSVKIPIPAEAGSNFKIESLAYSAKGDGSFEGYASVLVKLRSTDTMTVYAAFTTGDDCITVALFPRPIIKTPQVAYMGLVELLKGPTPEEVNNSAITQIPLGVKINSVRIVGNTVYADFDQTLQQGIAGSCRVQAIRSQIIGTLKQFLGISNVIISIDGRTEDILQP